MTIATDLPSAAPSAAPAFDFRGMQDAILTALANMNADASLAEHTPVIPALYARMSPDLLVNAEGQVLLLHEKPMPDPIWWVEYEPEERELVFITTTGQIMPFGLKIHDVVDTFLRYARVMYMVELNDDGKIVRADERRVVVRKNGKE
jgi:diadenosine tetraphosphatase ApaH/serine/threonine PP2A family protein phosphatase